MPVPNTSMLPGTEKAPTAGAASLRRAVNAAHAAVDRFSDSAEPKVRQLGENVVGAEAALHARADQLSRTGDEWAQGIRSKVRRHPLAALTVAFALGALIVRFKR